MPRTKELCSAPFSIICEVKGKLANKKWSVSRLGQLNLPIHKSIPVLLDRIYRYNGGGVFSFPFFPIHDVSLSEFLYCISLVLVDTQELNAS